MAHLELRCVFPRGELLAHRLGDFLAAVTGVDAPQSGDAVEHFAAVFGPVVHALGAREKARLRLELTVGRERHPECFEIGARGGWHGENPGEETRTRRARMIRKFDRLLKFSVSYS